jgi:hypothetical protein
MPPEQFAIIHDFTQEHMPNLFKLATKSPPWRRVRLMRYAFTRMMTFNQARNDDQLRDKVATDIESEDEMFSILDQWEDASPSEQPALHEKLHDQMQQVVDNLLTERMERLDRLKSRLDEEEKKLADDRAHRDEIVDDRVERWTTEGPLRPPTTAPTTMPAK